VVEAGQVGLDDDRARVLAGLLERGPHLVVGGLEVDRHAAAVVGVERLDDHRVAQALGRAHALVGAAGQDRCCGTGRPRSPRILLVSSLSDAISTAMWRVSLVTVAWMRFWYLPWPNWTSECR
jgi:hypothetical protein